MVIDCWNDTDCLAKLAKAVPYAFIAPRISCRHERPNL